MGNRRPRMRELSDIVGGGASRAEAALGASAALDAWDAITHTVDGALPAVDRTRSRHALDDGGGGGHSRPSVRDDRDPHDAALAAPHDEKTLLASETPGPNHRVESFTLSDLSLKTRALVVSTFDLKWSVRLPQSVCHAAVQTVSAASPGLSHPVVPQWLTGLEDSGTVAPVGEDQADEMLLFACSLLHFRHPASSLISVVTSQWQALVSPNAPSSSMMAIAAGAGEVNKIVAERVDAWQGALRSLFYGFRFRQVMSFYVVLNSTVVHFVGPAPQNTSSGGLHGVSFRDLCHSDDLSAVVSRATPGFRALLDEFGIPVVELNGKSDRNGSARRMNRDGDGDLTDEDDGELSGATTINQSGPLLIRGAVNTQAFFNFLIDVGPRIGNATDVPSLISDQPFSGGQLSSCIVRDARETQTADGSTRQSVCVEGYMTPLQVSRLWESLHTLQMSDYTIFLTSEKRSCLLNAYNSRSAGSSSARENGQLRDMSVVTRLACTGSPSEPVMFGRDARSYAAGLR